MIRNQFILDIQTELIVDNFAGGGGASTGIELALGRPVDISINHDPQAVALHSANHPQTRHLCEDVFTVDPRAVTCGRPVGLAWFSPDCKHFSKAKGGKPRSKKIRGLAWVALKWAVITGFRVGILENVEEFQTWGPLLKNGDPDPRHKGRTFRAFIDCLTTGITPNHPDLPEILEVLGNNFPVQKLIDGLGYDVEYRELRACDFGAPTIRKRFFLIMRCDGRPIVWPAASHGDPKAPGFRKSGLKPWRTAADCIDWTLPCPSIFLTREEAKVIGVKRPLAEATLKRLAKGIRKFVIEAKEPFIVSLTHQGGDRNEAVTTPFRTVTGAHRGEKALAVPFTVGAGGPTRSGEPRTPNKPFVTQLTRNDQYLAMPFLTEHANASTQRNFPADEPLRTQCAEVKGGHFALATPMLSEYHGERTEGDVRSKGVEAPLPTQDTSNRFALVNAFLAKHYGGVTGSKVTDPIGTITSVDHHSLVAANLMINTTGHSGGAADNPAHTIVTEGHHHVVASHLTKFYGTNVGQKSDAPMHSVTSGGQHLGEVRAFLMKYYGNEKDGVACNEPLHTIPTRDRFGLVTIEGTTYEISDIGMRMLTPRELYRAQGFPESYRITTDIEVTRHGKRMRIPLSGEAQVRMCGNSVCPPIAEALVSANVPEMAILSKRERKKISRRYVSQSVFA